METILPEYEPFWFLSPHSLGKLIEWKHEEFLHRKRYFFVQRPHSLGKLIEWKPLEDWSSIREQYQESPLAGETN